MEHRLSLSLRTSQALTFRQALSAELHQGLRVVQEPALSFEHYREREDLATRLYRNALQRGRVRGYRRHGMRFEYALIRARDVPDQLLNDYGWAFSHCLYNGFEALILGRRAALARGSWLLFVVDDLLPNMGREGVEYAAVHERGEQVTLGDHNLACKLEFAVARKEGKLTRYMDWLETNYARKFVDAFSYKTHTPLPDSDELAARIETQCETEEALIVRALIEEFEWPTRLLSRIKLHRDGSEEAKKLLAAAFRVAEIVAGEPGSPLKATVERVRSELSSGLYRVQRAGLDRYLSYDLTEVYWQTRRVELDRVFLKRLSLSRGAMLDHVQEVTEAGIQGGLPDDGALSLSLQDALRTLQDSPVEP